MATFRETYPDYPTLFDAMRKRPGMFIGKQSIYGLSRFVGGMRFAEKISLDKLSEYHLVGAKDVEHASHLPCFQKTLDMHDVLEQGELAFIAAAAIANSASPRARRWLSRPMVLLLTVQVLGRDTTGN